MKSTTLFERLGGSPGIRTIVDDIVALHLENPVIQARFHPYLETPDKVELVKRHTCEFLETGSGGPAQYTGRSMREAHRGMNISAAEFMAATDDILATLKKRGIDDETQREVLGIVYSLKGDIMHA